MFGLIALFCLRPDFIYRSFAYPAVQPILNGLFQHSKLAFTLLILMNQRIDIGLCVRGLFFEPRPGLFIQRYRHLAHVRTFFCGQDYARKAAGRQS